MSSEMRSGVIGKEREMNRQQEMAKRSSTDVEPILFFVSGQQRMMKSEEAELVVNTCKQYKWNVAKQILLK